ncbi:MAG TPA: MFS transporter [Afifellaceae bacterium]|nr:MFS transporter [Afifellaceae bacterium]
MRLTDTRFALLPKGAAPEARLLLAARGLRAVADGMVSLLLPVYLLELGHGALETGIIATATLAGSALLTLLVGVYGGRAAGRTLLIAATILMMLTGIAFAGFSDFWPLLVIAFLGTLNPSSGDVSVFLPLEQAELTRMVEARGRTRLFARYSFIGSTAAAIGALAAALPEIAAGLLDADLTPALQAAFLAYAAVGSLALLLYRRLPRDGTGDAAKRKSAPLGRSRRIVLTLAALFSLDAFAGGLVVQSLLALWLFDRFGLSIAAAGAIFFWTGILSALSYFAAAWLADRIGLVNTMVFTHLPANLCLMLVPFAPTLWLAILLLMVRSALSQMDVPTRTSYVMAVVTPEERPAAASVTAVPRSLAAAGGPVLAGAMLAASPFGWPLVAAGALKIAYDLMLLAMFGKVRPPEEDD